MKFGEVTQCNYLVDFVEEFSFDWLNGLTSRIYSLIYCLKECSWTHCGCSMDFHLSWRQFFCVGAWRLISFVVGAASFLGDSHLLNRRRLSSASEAVRTELLHEQAVLYTVISVLSCCTWWLFISECFKFSVHCKESWWWLNIECSIFLLKIEGLIAYSTEEDNVIMSDTFDTVLFIYKNM